MREGGQQTDREADYEETLLRLVPHSEAGYLYRHSHCSHSNWKLNANSPSSQTTLNHNLNEHLILLNPTRLKQCGYQLSLKGNHSCLNDLTFCLILSFFFTFYYRPPFFVIFPKDASGNPKAQELSAGHTFAVYT